MHGKHLSMLAGSYQNTYLLCCYYFVEYPRRKLRAKLISSKARSLFHLHNLLAGTMEPRAGFPASPPPNSGCCVDASLGRAMSSISQPLLTEAVLCPRGHGACLGDCKPFLLPPFLPQDTLCPRLPAAVGGHTSTDPGYRSALHSHTTAGVQVQRRASCLNGSSSREWPQGSFHPRGPFA